MEKLTKTDRFLLLIKTVYEKGPISDDQFREILDNPSKSQYHKYLTELTKPNNSNLIWIIRKKINGNYWYYPGKEIDHTMSNRKIGPNIYHAHVTVNFKMRDQINLLLSPLQYQYQCTLNSDNEWDIWIRYHDHQEFLNELLPLLDQLKILGPDELLLTFESKIENIQSLQQKNVKRQAS